jgi:hypothetical protein
MQRYSSVEVVYLVPFRRIMHGNHGHVEISPRAQCHNDMTSEVIRYIASGGEHIDYIQG